MLGNVENSGSVHFDFGIIAAEVKCPIFSNVLHLIL